MTREMIVVILAKRIQANTMTLSQVHIEYREDVEKELTKINNS